MSLRHMSCVATILSLLGGAASAQHIVPNALLTIDQNRATVIERIVGEWGDRLAVSNAGISAAQLRQILFGLRSDHLLAASLAGSVEGLRDVVSGALVRTDAAVAPTLMHTKSLGDTIDDLVYTPVVPCRIVDTRSGAGGVFLPGNQRNWLAFSLTGFASQGGSVTNCGIPVHPAAIMANTTLANTVGGPEFFVLWPFGQSRPLAATVNWWASAQQPANAEIVPLCTGGGCTSDFSAYASGQTHAIIDVLGYFNRPTNYGGTHTITGQHATDSGGFGNTASGDFSTVAGGQNNTASGGDSTVAGGLSNIASGATSTVAGGIGNMASGSNSTVAGGNSNTAGPGNYSTVAGGGSNTASGDSSTVAGGFNNTAVGAGSFAAGRGAKADADGCFVWNDGSGGEITCGGTSAVHHVVMRADGGYIFFTKADNSIGADLASGAGAWTIHSDRAVKDHLQPIDGRWVLQQLAAMSIATWNWKSQDTSIRHMGPMAQDFHAAFGLGETDKGINTVDGQGVALAAIQGLYQMMRQKDAKLRQQSQEISALKRKLQAIEAKLGM